MTATEQMQVEMVYSLASVWAGVYDNPIAAAELPGVRDLGSHPVQVA